MAYTDTEKAIASQLANAYLYRDRMGCYCLAIHRTSGEMVGLYNTAVGIFSPDVDGDEMDAHCAHFSDPDTVRNIFTEAMHMVGDSEEDISEALAEL